MMNNDDLISRADALNCFHDWIDSHGDVHTADEMSEYQRIEQLPSAQPEIIRCKDCKHFIRDISCVEGRYNGCDEWTDNGNEIEVAEDDFCSYAERRADE